MKKSYKILLMPLVVLGLTAEAEGAEKPGRNAAFDLEFVLQLQLGDPVGQFRAVPVNLGKGQSGRSWPCTAPTPKSIRT